MTVFRIALQTFGATARGRARDYAAQSRSLARLERLVHYKRFDCLAPHVIYRVSIPDEHIETLPAFPSNWNADDPAPEAQAIRNDWWDNARSPALQVRGE